MASLIEITRFDAPALDPYARLSEAQLFNREHPENGLFIAESPRVILRALDAGFTPVSLLMEERHIEEQGAELIARCGDVPVYFAPFEVLTQLTGFKLTRGALCLMRRPSLPEVSQVCANACRVAVLENVMNPTNVGAIFRSAAALNIDAVLLTPACTDPFYRRAIRVSMGTVFQIPWTFFPAESWPQEGLALLKHLGFKTAAMALTENALSIRTPGLAEEKKLAIVLGTEGDGLAERTIALCDVAVKIPMSHGVDSLNVAAASAVAFWQLQAL